MGAKGDNLLYPVIDPIKYKLVEPVRRVNFIRQTVRNLNTLVPWMFERNQHWFELAYLRPNVFSEPVNYSDYWKISEFHTKPLTNLLKQNRVLIGIELSPGFKKYLNDHQVTYLDIRLSPLRFASDLLLRVDSNKYGGALSKFAVDQAILHESANAWKSSPVEKVQPRAVLYLQKKWDFALLTESGFSSDLEVLKAFEAKRTDESVVVVSHPFSKASPEAIDFVGSRSNFSFRNNLGAYESFSKFNSACYAAYSSSILEEAPYFGCEAERIGHDAKNPGQDLSNRNLIRMLMETGLVSRTTGEILPIRKTLAIDWSRAPWPKLPPV